MGGVIQASQLQSGAPTYGQMYELYVIAAVVVGGVAISGGRGNLWGVLAGLVLLACISPALTHLRIEAYWEKAIQGAVILLAISKLFRNVGGFLVIVVLALIIYAYYSCWSMASTSAFCTTIRALPFLQ